MGATSTPESRVTSSARIASPRCSISAILSWASAGGDLPCGHRRVPPGTAAVDLVELGLERAR